MLLHTNSNRVIVTKFVLGTASNMYGRNAELLIMMRRILIFIRILNKTHNIIFIYSLIHKKLLKYIRVFVTF
jgi:hypothetical protein